MKKKNKVDSPAQEHAYCSAVAERAKTYFNLMQSQEITQTQKAMKLIKQDRVNLDKALQIVLDKQGDFYHLFMTLSFYYQMTPHYQEACKWMEGVVKKLDLYSHKDDTFLSRYIYVIANLGAKYLQAKDHGNARKNFEKALKLLSQTGREKQMAVVYHHLGMTACEEQKVEEAKQHFQEAAKLYRKFQDRYSLASIYRQLGQVAVSQKEFPRAFSQYALALEIFSENIGDQRVNMILDDLETLLNAWTEDEARSAAANLEDIGKKTREVLSALVEHCFKEKEENN